MPRTRSKWPFHLQEMLMSRQLTDVQVEFLKAYAQASRSVRDIMNDGNIALEDLVTWTRKNKAFRRRLRGVEFGHRLVREMQLRQSAVEAARLAWATLHGDADSHAKPWQARLGQLSIDQARKADQTSTRGRRSALKPDDLADPVHPAYRAEAYRVLSEMQARSETTPAPAIGPANDRAPSCAAPGMERSPTPDSSTDVAPMAPAIDAIAPLAPPHADDDRV
jgi:hypothetical protein